MFKIVKDTFYPFPVDVKIPNDRLPGQFVTHRFDVQFRVLSTSERDQLLQQAVGGFDKALVERVVCGWADGEIVDAEGAPMPFTPENLALVCEDPRVLGAIVEAYRRSVQGEAVQHRRAGN